MTSLVWAVSGGVGDDRSVCDQRRNIMRIIAIDTARHAIVTEATDLEAGHVRCPRGRANAGGRRRNSAALVATRR